MQSGSETQILATMLGLTERKYLSEYLPYTTHRMRLLSDYTPLKSFLELPETRFKLRTTPVDENQDHATDRLGASIYNRVLKMLARDEIGHVFLEDAISHITHVESRRIKEMGGADVDVLVIGTGVHGATFANRMRERSPHANILMLTEQDQRIGTFGRLDFRLNTEAGRVYDLGYSRAPGERGGADDAGHGHHIDIALAEHDIAWGYPRSKQVSLPNEQVEGVLAAPAVDLTRATKVRKTTSAEKEKGHNKKYAVETIDILSGEPVIYYANVVFGAPGAGIERKLKGVDDLSRNAKELVLPSELAENFLDICGAEDVYNMVKEGVSIVGGGDSGRIAAEKLISKLVKYLENKSPEEQDRIKRDLKGKITWNGVHFTDQAGYLKEVTTKFEVGKRQYEGVAPYIKDPSEEPNLNPLVIPDLIVPVVGHVDGVVEGEGHKPQVIVNGTAGKEQALVISAIGYDNEAIAALASDFSDPATNTIPLEDVGGRLDGITIPIARKIAGEDIYWGGAVNKFKASPGEEKRGFEPGITMHTLTPRTEALADQIAHTLVPDIQTPKLDDLLQHAADEEFASQRALLPGEKADVVGTGLMRPHEEHPSTPTLTPIALEIIYRETEEGHKPYEREIYGEGVVDPNWSTWYSLHMAPILERKYALAIPTSRIKLLLERADGAFQRYAADAKKHGATDEALRASLPKWYAEYIFARLETGDIQERPIQRSFAPSTQEQLAS